PGGSFTPGPGTDDQNIQSVLEQQGITPDMFETVSKVLDTTFAGSVRPVIMKTDLSYEIADTDPLIRFTLLPGQYATTVLRELMKGDPLHMI
ncbi:tRNA pseudouridine(13) synthase TruD, partial [Methanospirillum sp.]